MLTKNEINTLSLSPTKKDFVQIWNELLEVAGKLSERWDPTSTNESDPGIVILKALTGIADKLNYNIDKNTLEAFMPTAAQEDSMRKLCDMLGYNIKYYRSAETEVTIKYHNSDQSQEEKDLMDNHGSLEIPKFTVITNSDKDISYFTTNEKGVYISNMLPAIKLPCMEGQIVKCESTADNGVITAAQISENNRFYLPETQIAENGIFVYNASVLSSGLVDGTSWKLVDNLNIQSRGARVFRFGYDSYEGRPYVEFPVDYRELINDGLFIYYARTSGANGNVSARTLTQLELPTGGNWSKLSADSFSVENAFAATTGSNIETIRQAYNNFKRTVGTFETLVTCRDYMNKIYTMVDGVGRSCVSNILVTDIRNDLNRAVTICSCDDAGIFYKDMPLTTMVTKTSTINLIGETEPRIATFEYEEPTINHFDLVLYPFKSYSQIRSLAKNVQETYDASFNYSSKNLGIIQSELADVKTIAHNIILPRDGDVVSINNYLRLNAIVGTHSKITTEEAYLLREKIKIALANAFNMRELDFGEEIPFESIVEVIETADPRIKVVSLNEPGLYTTFSVFKGNDNAGNPILKEYAVASDNWLTEEQADKSGRFEMQKEASGNYSGTFDTNEAKKTYNKLVVRNILAGRVPLFNYNTTFTPSFSEGAYKATQSISTKPDKLPTPNELNPYTIYVDNGKTYTGQYQKLSTDEKPINLVVPTEETQETTYIDAENNIYTGQWQNGVPVYSKVTYTEAVVPEKYSGNVITKKGDNNITEITTSCEITPDEDGSISDVTLEAGEFIKFRAPNYRTTATYPAYVNYRLNLARDTLVAATGAEADTLFNRINQDSLWDAVFEDGLLSVHKKTFTLSQKVKVSKPSQNADFTIEKLPAGSNEESPDAIFKRSGSIRLVSPTPTLKWADEKTTGAPVITVGSGSTFVLPNFNENEFIPDIATLDIIRSYVDSILKDSSTSTPEEDFIISFNFEYIPFEVGTLLDWEKFVLANLAPAADNSILWRIYGDGYADGKYILNGGKLLPFNSNYFGLLDNNYKTRLHGIYVATNLGNDAESNFIGNNEEYELKDGESLYIEYTPSTTDEGTAAQESVQKVYGKGTIIRPNGFEEGLKASTAYEAEGHSPFKALKFLPTSDEVKLHSLGTNEQIEVRELSAVTLKGAVVYVYKNFDCPELESGSESEGASGISYTLKDGEYIFYTDKDKAEFAYYGAGTEVTLTGRVYIEKRDIIELSTIFDSGIQEIPWQSITLAHNDSITFQEYQYITLGAGDTLNRLSLHNTPDHLDGSWQYCDSAYYTPAGATTRSSLPKINVSTREGSGWEATSVFELNTSPSLPQVIRNTGKVKTEVTLHRNSASGTSSDKIVLSASKNAPLSFKSNIACQSNNGKVKLSEVYTNTEKLKSFEFKVFSEQAPAVIKTKPNHLVPLGGSAVWETAADGISQTADYWNQINLEHITPDEDREPHYDRALKLSVAILPGTYGIFSIYVPKNVSASAVWLELLPGVSGSTVIELFNTKEPAWSGNKFILKPGLNCIRVDKTCDIFIKAGSGLEGTLYFDNLRLVNTALDIDDQESVITHGLNLSQLGYLPVSDEGEGTFNIFNMRARTKLKTELTNKALADIESLEKTVASELAGTEAKAKKLETFTESLVADISAMKTISKADSLLTHYKTLHNDLENEIALKEALDKNEDVTDQLATLAKTFVTTESEKQELLNKLVDLKAATIKNGDRFNSLPEEELLADFTAAATSLSDKEQKTLVAELKYSSLEKINSQYDEQLAPIIESLNNITEANAEDLEKIINNLYASDQAELFNQIAALFDASKNNLSAGINAVSVTAAGDMEGKVNYSELAQQLEVLREYVLTLDINTILSKIDLAATEHQYKELALLVEQLKTLLAAEDTLLVQAIDTLLVTVRAKTNSTPDSTITTAITKINEQIIKDRNTRVSEVLTDIKEIVSGFADYDKIMEDLSDIAGEQINDIKGQLDLVISQRASLVSAVTAFTNIANIVSLPFSTEAVAAVWPKYMKLALVSAIVDWYSKIRAAMIQEDAPELTTDSISNRLIIKQAANIEAFQELFELAKNFKNSETQNSARYDLIIALSSFNTLSADLNTALDNIASHERNAVISGIISELQESDTDIGKKQRLFKILAEELAKEIVLDTQLVNIAAKLLCPSVLAFEEVLPEATEEDVFYQKVRNYITGLKNTLIDATNISNWCANNSKSEDDLKTEVFPDTYRHNITYQQELVDIKDCELFKWLTKEDLKVAWEMPTGEWIDRYGEKLDLNTTTVDVKLSHGSGEWQDTTGTVMIVKADTFDSNTKTWSIWYHKTGDTLEEIELTYPKLKSLMSILLYNVRELGQTRIPDDYKKEHGMNITELEEQLLEEIRSIDKNRDFYYNVPIEANVALDFNVGDSKLNTLMNPALNYDINNVNNSFVISKLDINYLDEGIQIARSSRT